MAGIAASSGSLLRASLNAQRSPRSSSASKTASRMAPAVPSIGFQLLAAIETCADLFTRFGGHAFAVGFALPAESLPELKRRLADCAAERLAQREPERVLTSTPNCRCIRSPQCSLDGLRKLEPLGHGNPEPIFMARSARLVSAPRFMKERHLRLELRTMKVGCNPRRRLGYGGGLPNSVCTRDRASTSPTASAKTCILISAASKSRSPACNSQPFRLCPDARKPTAYRGLSCYFSRGTFSLSVRSLLFVLRLRP